MPGEWPYSVDTENVMPVYLQIENQIRFSIAAKRLAPGASLPSVRELSTHLGVNVNTVTKAYRELEILDILLMRRGLGVSVASKAYKLCRDVARRGSSDRLLSAVSECLASGMKATEVRGLVGDGIRSGALPYAGTKSR